MMTSPVPDWVFSLLRCPISGSELSLPDDNWFFRLEVLHSDSPLQTKRGRSISRVPSQGLLSADHCWLYVIDGEIIQLIADEAIEVPLALR